MAFRATYSGIVDRALKGECGFEGACLDDLLMTVSLLFLGKRLRGRSSFGLCDQWLCHRRTGVGHLVSVCVCVGQTTRLSTIAEAVYATTTEP